MFLKTAVSWEERLLHPVYHIEAQISFIHILRETDTSGLL